MKRSRKLLKSLYYLILIGIFGTAIYLLTDPIVVHNSISELRTNYISFIPMYTSEPAQVLEKAETTRRRTAREPNATFSGAFPDYVLILAITIIVIAGIGFFLLYWNAYRNGLYRF